MRSRLSLSLLGRYTRTLIRGKMKKVPFSFIVAGAIIILLFAVLLMVGIPYFFEPRNFRVSAGATLGSQTVLARITQIVDEGQINLNGRNQLYQVMQVEILEGDYKGISFQIDYGKRQVRNDNFRFQRAMKFMWK